MKPDRAGTGAGKSKERQLNGGRKLLRKWFFYFTSVLDSEQKLSCSAYLDG